MKINTKKYAVFVAHNPKVVGSNPAPATTFYKALKAIMSLRPFWFLGLCSDYV